MKDASGRKKPNQFPERQRTIIELCEVGLRWRMILAAVGLEWRQVHAMMQEDRRFGMIISKLRIGAPQRLREAKILSWAELAHGVNYDPRRKAIVERFRAAMAMVPPHAK